MTPLRSQNRPDGERETILQAKSTEHKAPREIYQCLTGVAGRDNLAVPTVIVIVSEINLHLQSKVFEDFVLKRVIPQRSVSADRHVSGRQARMFPGQGAAGAARAPSMIRLVPNILVRFLTQDDPIQSPRATEIIERRLTEENLGFVSILAMVESVWVLDRTYRLAACEIAAAVERMLQTDVLVVENEQEVCSEMIALKKDADRRHCSARQESGLFL